MTRVLVAIKRVADTGEQVVLTSDGQGLDGRMAGWTIGDHDSCAVELALQLVEGLDGDDHSVTVLSVGEEAATEQLRSALALGATSAILVEADPATLGPSDVAREIAAVVGQAQEQGVPYDLVLLGNDAPDSGDFQVPVRTAYALERPVVTGVRRAEVADDTLVASVDGPYGRETYELPLPAVAAVIEGGVEPRYPTLRGRMAAKKVQIDSRPATGDARGGGRVTWHVPPPAPSQTTVLGEGPTAAPEVVEVLRTLGVLS